MALNIGQKRNVDYDSSSFANSLLGQTSWSNEIHSRNPFQEGDFFEDSGFIFNQTFSPSQVYYFVLTLPKQSSEIVFDIRLQKDNDCGAEDPYQIIKSGCILNKSLNQSDEEKNKNYFDFVFTPDRNVYNRLVCCIKRQANDVLRRDSWYEDVYYPRKIIPDGEENPSYAFYSLNNLRSDGNYWKKIGVQTRPGSLIVINKQPIRIGRSGIYELNNGTKITNFMITSGLDTNSEADPFLVDYVYEQSSGNGG